MPELTFRYTLSCRFDRPVSAHRFTLRCLPVSDARQNILTESLKIRPEPSLSNGEDPGGCRRICGTIEEPHDFFDVCVQGSVCMAEAYRIPAEPREQLGIFRTFSPLTHPGPALRELYASLQELPVTGPERLIALCSAVHRSLAYCPGTTCISTSAEAALQQRTGVCQDYAHILLAICRLDGIACRYAAGLVPGDGQTHAWVEAESGGCWYGLDPTAGTSADGRYIKFTHGRDAGDCPVNLGLFRGSAAETLTASAEVADRRSMEGPDLL